MLRDCVKDESLAKYVLTVSAVASTCCHVVGDVGLLKGVKALDIFSSASLQQAHLHKQKRICTNNVTFIMLYMQHQDMFLLHKTPVACMGKYRMIHSFSMHYC